MTIPFKELIYTDDSSDNWFHKKYYFCGGNFRYYTFQLALNLLSQRTKDPVIVETGCQRQKDDVGAGMSTSIFGEYCKRYGGHLYTVDLIKRHLDICKECTTEFQDHITYVCSDSLAWLGTPSVSKIDLLYLDSYDYPDGEVFAHYGMDYSALNQTSQEEVLRRHGDLINPCQVHCQQEFRIAERMGKIHEKTIVLIDDNHLPGGGKSRLAKEFLSGRGWICLLDSMQSLWVKGL